MSAYNEIDPEVERVLQFHKKTKALMCSGWAREEKIADLHDPTLNEQELKKRVLSFFKSNEANPIDLEGYFAEKTTPNLQQNPELRLMPATIVLYGLDFMPMPKVIKYFSYFNPLEIIWLNDSSCLITFQNDAVAKRAIVQNCLDYTRKQFLRQFYNEITHENVTAEDLEWVELIHYYELGFERSLFARLATEKDSQSDFNIAGSMFIEYQNRKKIFLDQYMDQKRAYQNKMDAERMLRRGPRSERGGGMRRERERDRPERRYPQERERYHQQRERYHEERERGDLYQRPRCFNSEGLYSQANQSRLNYSFARNPQIKQMLELQSPEKDLSMCSFARRFDQMSINDHETSHNQEQSFHINRQNESQNISSFLNKSNAREANLSFNTSQRNNMTGEVKAEQEQNMSFKKGEVIVISDDDD